MTTAVIIILLILLFAYYIGYCDIEINSDIYVSKNTGEQFKVIEKGFIYTTLSRVCADPVKVYTIDFLLNYTKY